MIQFLRGYKIRDLGSASAVQIMTVHKAKGLTYDMAILADVEGNKLTSSQNSKNPVMVDRGESGVANWVLRQPRGEFVEAIPELAAVAAVTAEENAYEALCKLYVAMTRPKFALYIIAEPQKGNTLNYRKLLGSTLGESSDSELALGERVYPLSYAEGNAEWWREIKAEAKEPERKSMIAPLGGGEEIVTAVVPEPMIASGEEDGVDQAELMRILNGYGSAAAEFGTAVHALFEQVEWLDKDEALEVQLERAWGESERFGEEERMVVKGCLEVPEIRNYFEGDRAAVEVWRERSFDVLIADSKRVVGVFDRVLVGTDFAVVLDFKTDRCDPGGEAEIARRHAHQLELYRSAVSVLTGLPEDTVMAGVVVCRAQSLVWV